MLPPFVQADADLAPLNTLALPARAAFLATVTHPDELGQLAVHPDLARRRRFVLGGGSNLVLTGDVDGLVLRMAIPGKALVAEDDDAWYVRAGAGESWHDFVRWTLARGWPGLENLSLIPGTVGSAPIQNIGAYGLEAGDRFYRLEARNMVTGEDFTLDREACRFAYRDSRFKQEGWHLDGSHVITAVTFRLPKDWQPLTRYADLAKELDARGLVQPSARDISDAVIAVRQRKLPDPATLPNAGSFFQNPVVPGPVAASLVAAHPHLPHYPQPDGRVKLAAGWLIEQSGWKGRALGPAAMYEKQALVLVNWGGATGAQVAALMAAVQADVREKFGIELMPEPIFL